MLSRKNETKFRTPRVLYYSPEVMELAELTGRHGSSNREELDQHLIDRGVCPRCGGELQPCLLCDNCEFDAFACREIVELTD